MNIETRSIIFARVLEQNWETILNTAKYNILVHFLLFKIFIYNRFDQGSPKFPITFLAKCVLFISLLSEVQAYI